MSNNKKTVQPKIVSPIFVTPRLVEPKAIKIPFGGKSSPQPINPTWLYFTLPEGGTVSLMKKGTPTAVTLEYSLDNGNTWKEWIETNNKRSLVLAAGQNMYVRNTSETSTGFSTGSSHYYKFSFTDETYVGGDINSLLCKVLSNASVTNYCFSNLFNGSSNLKISNTFILSSTTPESYCYRNMFYNCTNVNLIKTNMTDISAANCLFYWLDNVSPTGDFYCPAELTIPTGSSGIPSGWTRHDLPTT